MTDQRINELNEFCKNTKITIKDLHLLDIALTHRSFINENRHLNLQHNERIEFLGDAVLELIVSEHLYKEFSDHTEGDLTSFRAAIVKTDSLARFAKELNYGKYLQMSHGEMNTGGREKEYLLANAFEAVLGAIYLDQGYETVKEFIARILFPEIKNIVSNRLDIDPKTKFQEIAQNYLKQTPVYKLVNEDGPDHEKIFTMATFAGDVEYGRGTGNSKQRAEENAALEALKNFAKTKSDSEK